MPNLPTNKRMFNLTNYLIKCDQIQKFNTQNVHQTFFVNNVYFNLTLEEVNKTVEENKTIDISEDLKIKSFLMMYILFSFLPFINFKDSKISKEKNFALILVLSKKKDINTFLEQFFFEYLLPLYKENFFFSIKRETIFNSKHSLNVKVPISIFISPNDLVLDSNLIFNTKEVYLNIDFIVYNKHPFLMGSQSSLFTNLPYFWRLEKKNIHCI